MKNLLFFSILLLLTITGVMAQTVEVNKNGDIRIVKEDDLGWRQLNKAEKEAYNHLGEMIPIDSVANGLEKTGFFSYRTIAKCSNMITFDGQSFKVIKKSSKVYSEEKFAVHFLVLLIAAFLMIVSNIVAIAKREDKDKTWPSILILVSFACLLFSLLVFIILVFGFSQLNIVGTAAIALFAVFIFLVVVFLYDKQNYYVSLTIFFYISFAVGMFFMI